MASDVAEFSVVWLFDVCRGFWGSWLQDAFGPSKSGGSCYGGIVNQHNRNRKDVLIDSGQVIVSVDASCKGFLGKWPRNNVVLKRNLCGSI